MIPVSGLRQASGWGIVEGESRFGWKFRLLDIVIIE